jgi:sugar-specific transcriptional regulator TrmB
LGFSPNQAKVYLALVALGSSSAKSVWKSSGVCREEVYRKLRELQEMGFVERIFVRPVRFRAIPLECVITTMLNRKSNEIAELKIKTEDLLHDFKKGKKRDKLKTDEPEIALIPGRESLLEEAKKDLESLKNSLDTINSWNKGINWMSAQYDYFLKALKRNVKIRFIIEKDEKIKFPRFVEKLQENPLFQIKTVQVLPPAGICLYDEKTLLIDTSSKSSFLESPVIWTNNPGIIGMVQIYFETLWTNTRA